MAEIIRFVTAMVALSVGVERIVEILKGMFAALNGKDMLIHVIGAVCGAVLAFTIGPTTFLDITPKTEIGTIAEAALLGLMASGGSAFWNNILDILHAVKVTKENALVGRGAMAKAPEEQSAARTRTR